MIIYRLCIFIFFILLTACASENNFAPVTDANQTVLVKPKIRKHKKVTTIAKAFSIDEIITANIQNRRTEANYQVNHWIWPAAGQVIGNFSSLNKGIDIAGNIGDPIYAAAGGKVVYCGDGLSGYGNLIIIKHNHSLLSTYAHNSLLLVKEGDQVIQGQKIAEMGNTGTDRVKLHFEIRQAGQAIDPSHFLF